VFRFGGGVEASEGFVLVIVAVSQEDAEAYARGWARQNHMSPDSVKLDSCNPQAEGVVFEWLSDNIHPISGK
jgi:hypothetical protein